MKSNNEYIKYHAKVLWAVSLLGSKCSICPENHISTLQFHHLNPKNKKNNVSRLINSCSDRNKIKKEIQKCKLFCANCHKKIHFNKNRYEQFIDQIEKCSIGQRFCKRADKRKWTKKLDKKLIQFWNEGLSIGFISQKMNRQPSVVKDKIKHLINNKIILEQRIIIPRKKAIKLTNNLKQAILELDEQKIPNRDISNRLNVSLDIVYKVIKENKTNEIICQIN